MKSVFFALALVCSGPDHHCILYETPASPHATVEECDKELQDELSKLTPADFEALQNKGGHFAASCFPRAEGVFPKDHIEEFEKMLGKPARFYGPPPARVDG